MSPPCLRDHVLILDFAARFADRAETLLKQSAYRVLTPRSRRQAVKEFDGIRGQVAFILADGESRGLASAMQKVDSCIRVFVLDEPEQAITAEMDSGPERWLSSLRTFP